MPGEIIVLITCPPEESETLANALVKERLAACVNIIQHMRSIFVWDGRICNELEYLLVVKTNRSMWDKLRERVKQLHSYEVPEIVSISLESGDQAYLDWLNAAVGAGV